MMWVTDLLLATVNPDEHGAKGQAEQGVEEVGVYTGEDSLRGYWRQACDMGDTVSR